MKTQKLTFAKSRVIPLNGSLRQLLVFFLLFSLSISPTLSAQEKSILVVQSNDSSFYKKFTQQLINKINTGCQLECSEDSYIIDNFTVDEWPKTLKEKHTYDLILTLGVKAQKVVGNAFDQKGVIQANTPIIHALIPLQDKINPKHLYSYLEQPYSRQLLVIRDMDVVRPEKPLGIFYTDQSEWRMKEILHVANEIGLPVISEYVATSDVAGLGKALKNMMPKVGLILMLPDKKLYNKTNIKEVLLTGYLQKVPFIGYSKALAKTGAIAAITTPQNILLQDIVEIVNSRLMGEYIRQQNYPSTHKIIINESIQNSLNFPIASEIVNADETEVIQ